MGLGVVEVQVIWVRDDVWLDVDLVWVKVMVVWW